MVTSWIETERSFIIYDEITKKKICEFEINEKKSQPHKTVTIRNWELLRIDKKVPIDV